MIGATHWTITKAHLAEVLAAPESERDDLIRGLDASIRREVESLLGAHSTSTGLLDSPATRAIEAVREIAETVGERDPLLDQHVGPWRVRARLGQGTTGTVYRAEREDGPVDGLVGRTVALKVIRAELTTGPAGDEAHGCFHAERHLLAGLDHPGIARLFGEGTLDDGRLWLAMEFVEGDTITAWANRHALDLQDRIQLFLGALDALAHAHRHLLIHRDLKPPHIVVEPGEAGRPRVCVLDFGVAAALDTAALSGSRPHTTRYAAPEQFLGEPLTASADVFALGLVLWELLAGRAPRRDDHGIVLESLSSAAPRGDESALRDDLDALMARALAPSPADRYTTAGSFATALRDLGHVARQDRPRSYMERFYPRGYTLR
ncbi:MAG: serine/threonine-protein kinase [Bacteroidota bacterium]